MIGDDQTKKNLETEIQHLRDWFEAADDNGLFIDAARRGHYTNGVNKLKKADDSVNAYPANFVECRHNITLARKDYTDALYSTGIWWRFFNIYGGGIWIYLAGFLIAVFIFYSFLWNTENSSFFLLQGNWKSVLVGIYASSLGIIGGLFRGMWFLKDLVSKRGYRKAFVWWFISCPFIGGIFGALTYFVILSGLVSIGKDADVENPTVIYALSIILGYSWTQMIALIENIANSISTKDNK